MDPASALQAAVRPISNSVEPDGLVPIFLVYGALPRLGLPKDPLPPILVVANVHRQSPKQLRLYQSILLNDKF